MGSVKDDILLNAVIVTGAGAAHQVGVLENLTLQVSGIIAGDTIDIEMSNDNPFRITPASQIWTKVGATITANGSFRLTDVPLQLRANVQAIAGGGLLTVKYAGRR